MKGVILDKDSFDRDDIDLSPLKNLNIQWTVYNSTKADETKERISQADIVITNKVKLSADIIDHAADLKLVLLAATGTDNVDVKTCSKRNIVVCNAREYATPAVAQHVFTLILNLTTNLISYHQRVTSGHWQKSDVFCLLDFPISELAGKTLGIIGYGVLGRKVAEIARAFDMEVLLCQRPGSSAEAGRLPLEELLARTDVLSLHCPLTDQTRNLIGAEQFKLMKKSAILINTARGAIVDSPALVSALQQGEIAGAGIDVLDVEPPREGHDLLSVSLPNLIVTPHNAWASRESRERLVGQLANNITAWLAGEPINIVNP